jgi:tetratricopeptide (TPR) repeat protein/TolB-like protein
VTSDPLHDAAAAIADGGSPDWPSLEASSRPEERGVLSQLRLVAALADAQRAAASDGGETWGPLQIVEQVGQGSFGAVYRAYDPRLSRDVALKLLKETGPQRAASTSIEEGRLLARIRHPNVVTVYGADVADGQAGLWMEFISGGTLEEALRAQGPFGAPEAAAIGATLCSALAEVHASGLVHGDIKAQNVMREPGGRVVLMDFSAGRDDRSRHDERAGTPLYLAPEVFEGAAPDVRSDIYGLGVLLFHLVTGVYPMGGRTLADVATAHKRGERLRLRDIRPDLPASFVTVVETALAAAPANRHPSAGAFEAALIGVLNLPSAVPAASAGPARPAGRRAVAAIAALLAVATLAAVWSLGTFRAARKAPLTPRVRSLAVMAVEDPASADPAFSAGLTSALAMELGRMQNIKVVAGHSSIHGRGTNTTPQEIARALGVDALFDATMDRSGDEMTLSARVVDATSGAPLWQQRFVRTAAGIPMLQHALSRAVTSSLNTRLNGSPATVRVTPAAYDAYIRARALWNTRTRDGLLQSRALYEQAIALDPNYAAAYAGLANSYTLLSVFGVLPKSDMAPKAKAAALRAIKLDPTLSHGYTALGYVLVEEWDMSGGERAYRRAIELNPNDALAHHWYALTMATREPEQAVTDIEWAHELDPLSEAIDIDVGVVYRRAWRLDEAIAHLTRAIRRYPGSVSARLTLGEAYYVRLSPAEAVLQFEQALARDPENGPAIMWLGLCYSQVGRMQEVRALIARALDISRKTYLRPQVFAALYASAGEQNEALRWIEKGVEMREDWVSDLRASAWLAPLHGNPRFQELANRVIRQRRF